MIEVETISRFKGLLTDSLTQGTFIKVTLGNYHGQEKDLKNIYVRRLVIKKKDKLAFTYRYQTRDLIKNYSVTEGLDLISSYLLSGFYNCTAFTTLNDLVLLFQDPKGHSLRINKPTVYEHISTSHDKVKHRLIPAAERPYLNLLRITDEHGVVYKKMHDKYKQINQYVALLDPLIRSFPAGTIKNVADMGSGKGYLTFALYDYLVNVLKQETRVIGVEYREDMVNLSNSIAVASDFGGLNFVQGSIEEYQPEAINLLIALHACDTATDDAIFKGISAGAQLIVVAPCCHKQIRKEIEKGKVRNELDFLTQHGIFLERQAEMVTDGLRALILEYFGYKTKVFEFISDAHTPKNVLIVGTKMQGHQPDQEAILQKISMTKEYFGITYHHLEKLAGIL